MRDPSTNPVSSVKYGRHVEENTKTQVAHQEGPLKPRPTPGVTTSTSRKPLRRRQLLDAGPGIPARPALEDVDKADFSTPAQAISARPAFEDEAPSGPKRGSGGAAPRNAPGSKGQSPRRTGRVRGRRGESPRPYTGGAPRCASNCC
ncbi:hypothetical protein EJ357_12095 [Streptomyces cyaneochromogenes]|uniref:Uncharacterized protein n=1 Tax=Streptomyces cyaneochromogenes TaxID=2496836 RepID=A0A3S9M4Q5_9ACTN|nr:hypothetical protein EJ357_12095 [Streptomyces cyaneochromogenes]